MRLIDADALCDDVMERYCKDCEKRKGMKRGKWRVIYEISEAPCRACEVDDLKMELDEAPTIEAEPVRHGKLLRTEAYPHKLYCGECYNTLIPNDEAVEQNWTLKPKYCMYCGAKLDKEEL